MAKNDSKGKDNTPPPKTTDPSMIKHVRGGIHEIEVKTSTIKPGKKES